MPQIQTIDLSPSAPRETPLSRFASGFGEQLGKNIQDNQDIDKLSQIYKQYQEEGKTLDDILMQVQTTKGISPTARANSLSQLLTMKKLNNDFAIKARRELTKAEKENRERQKIDTQQKSVYNIYKDAGMDDKEAQERSLVDSEATARNYYNKKTGGGKEDTFQKTVSKKYAEEYFDLQKEIPKLRDDLKNIDRLKELSSKVSLPTSILKGALGNEDLAEMKGLGFAVIQPMLKVFNPVGAIAQRKVEMIKDKFAVSPFDTARTARGKINTLERFAKQAFERAEKRMELIETRQFDKLKKFDEEADKIADEYLAVNFDEQDQNAPQNDEMVSGFVSAKDGRPLKPISKAQAQQLLEQGLIKNANQ